MPPVAPITATDMPSLTCAERKTASAVMPASGSAAIVVADAPAGTTTTAPPVSHSTWLAIAPCSKVMAVDTVADGEVADVRPRRDDLPAHVAAWREWEDDRHELRHRAADQL